MTVTIASTTDTSAQVKEAAKPTQKEFALTAETGESPPSTSDETTRSDGANVARTESPAAEAVSESVPESEVEAKESDEAVEATDEAVEATSDDEAEDVEASAEAVEEPTETEPQTSKPKRRRRGRSYKERASQLSREKAAETLRADRLAAELTAIRIQQSQVQAQQPPVAPTDDEVSARESSSEETDTASAKDAGAPDQENFETYEEYAEALEEYKVKQQVAKHLHTQEAQQRDSIARDRAQRAQEQVVAAHTARIDTFRSEHDDFDAVIDQGKDLPLSRPMQDAVVNSELGPALMYHLCQNPEECDRIAGLHPVLALKEMGKLEAQIETASTGPVLSATSITKAPRPIKPVGGGATASTLPLDQMDYQTYKRAREKEIRAELEGG